jgi:prepilin-type processing-associated H-X9-DG protein
MCFQNSQEGEGNPTASSRHPGGVHILMGDGAIKFVTDSIEAGDPNIPQVRHGGGGWTPAGSASPYGV